MFCSVTTFDRVSMKGGKWVYCVLIVILNFTRHDVCKGMFGSLVVSFLMPFCYPLGECILAITCNIAGSFAQFLKQFRSHLRGYFSTTCTFLSLSRAQLGSYYFLLRCYYNKVFFFQHFFSRTLHIVVLKHFLSFSFITCPSSFCA